MRIAVTGSEGLLGGHVVAALAERGHDVVGLDRRDPGHAQSEIEHRTVDITNPEALTAAVAGADAVVHTASLIDLHLGTPPRLDAVNVEGTRNVLAACRRQGVGRLVYVGSAEAITGAEPRRSAAEAAARYPTRHLTHYGVTKQRAEQLVLDANGPDLTTCATRTYGLYGPGDQTVLPMYLARQPRRSIRLIGPATALTDLVYAPNAAHAVSLLAERLDPDAPWAGRPVHVTDGPAVNAQRYLAELVAPLGYRISARAVPERLAFALAALARFRYRATRLERWARPALTRHALLLILQDYYLDASFLRDRVGYSPPVARAAAVAATQEWLMTEHGRR